MFFFGILWELEYDDLLRTMFSIMWNPCAYRYWWYSPKHVDKCHAVWLYEYFRYLDQTKKLNWVFSKHSSQTVLLAMFQGEIHEIRPIIQDNQEHSARRHMLQDERNLSIPSIGDLRACYSNKWSGSIPVTVTIP